MTTLISSKHFRYPEFLQHIPIIYNSRVRLSDIPPEAYEYVVNGKSAIEWVMERYAVTVDKASGIKSDPNAWSSDPRYIIDLINRVVRVSVETIKIVENCLC